MRLLDHDDWAQTHHGLLRRADCGIAASEWHRAARAGIIEPLHPGLARVPGTRRTREQAIMAAVLAAGQGAIASHRSAAHLWGIARPDDDPVDLIVPGRRRHPRLAAGVTIGDRPVQVHVHRPSDVARLTPQRRDAIPCTNILRTLLDLGAVAPDAVEQALITAMADGRTRLGALVAVVAEQGRSGRRGVVALREAIAEVSLDHKPVDSDLETTMAALATRYDLPTMEFHALIAGWEVDFWIVDTPIVLECDGWGSHGLDREQFERDRRRDDDLRGAGWVVLRFSYRAIVRRPTDTARRIRRSVARWGHHQVPPR